MVTLAVSMTLFNDKINLASRAGETKNRTSRSRCGYKYLLYCKIKLNHFHSSPSFESKISSRSFSNSFLIFLIRRRNSSRLTFKLSNYSVLKILRLSLRLSLLSSVEPSKDSMSCLNLSAWSVIAVLNDSRISLICSSSATNFPKDLFSLI